MHDCEYVTALVVLGLGFFLASYVLSYSGFTSFVFNCATLFFFVDMCAASMRWLAKRLVRRGVNRISFNRKR